MLNGGFREVLDDSKQVDPSRVRRLLICSGKVFYDLHEERERRNLDDVAILRVEQIYPLHEELLASLLGKYRHAATVAWVQEESQNMGAWSFIEPRLRTMGVSIQYVGRDASASPATGVKKVHEKEQKELVEQALTGSLTHLVRANFPKAKSGDTGGTQRELSGAKAH